ncbi:MAG: hypothetical protein ACRCX8_00560 [Sarcina sp.]
MSKRLLELIVSFFIYIVIIVCILNILLSINFEEKINTIRARNNLIENFIETE